MLAAVDILLFWFHALLVLFNLSGWIWPRTRRLHLATISATLLSWTLLGVFHGFGYCPCTDWHWSVKRSLGERPLSDSYITHYLRRFTGVEWNADMVDVIVVALALAAFAISLTLNLRNSRQASTAANGNERAATRDRSAPD